MRGGSRRGSYFFVLDAFLAGIIIVFTIILIYSFFVSQRQTEQSYTYAHDYLSFITSTEVRDYQDPAVMELAITDQRRTLSEQILVFFYEDNQTAAAVILNATAKSVPASVAITVKIRDPDTESATVLYTRGTDEIAKKKMHLVAKSVQYALIDDSTIYGPLIVQVEVWV